MYLCYDVVRIILKIKYNNWLNEKMCLCGGDDFKKCLIVECYDCPRNYCLNQKGYKNWMWKCSYCLETFCGYHDFKTSRRNNEKYCSICVRDDVYEVQQEYEIPCLSDNKMLILMSSKKYPESPEY